MMTVLVLAVLVGVAGVVYFTLAIREAMGAGELTPARLIDPRGLRKAQRRLVLGGWASALLVLVAAWLAWLASTYQ